jgi:SAM-dependent methyltransferase
MSERTGSYPIETRSGEVERLKVQDAALAEATQTMLDLLPVAPGWRCLDLGCGPRGITHDLASRVGAGGHVTGLDADDDFIGLANSQRLPNTDYVLGDAYSTEPSISSICGSLRPRRANPSGWLVRPFASRGTVVSWLRRRRTSRRSGAFLRIRRGQSWRGSSRCVSRNRKLSLSHTGCTEFFAPWV